MTMAAKMMNLTIKGGTTMKRLFFFLASSVLLFVACQKNESMQNGSLIINAKIQDSDEAVKAEISFSDGFKWNSSDKIGLAQTDDYKQPSSSSTVLSSEDREASFTFSGLTDGKTYIPFYPVWASDDALYGYSNTGSLVCWMVKNTQTQTVSDKLEAGRFALIGTSNIDYSGSADKEVNDAYFDLFGTVIRFLVYGGEAEETISSVSIEKNGDTENQDNRLAGKLFSNNTSWSDQATDEKVTVTLGYSQSANVAKADAKAIYAFIIPTHYYVGSTLTGIQYKYKVVTNKHTYTFTSAENKIYENKKVYTMPLNLASSKVVKE